MKSKGNIAIVISVLALILAILAVIRCDPMTVDWLGILVGILALLVTVLLGWNIYSAVYMDKIINKKIDSAIVWAQKKADRKIKIALATAQMRIINGYIANEDWYMVMKGYSTCIWDILQLQEKKMAGDIIPLIDSILYKIIIKDEKGEKAFGKLLSSIKKLSTLDERACDLYRKALDVRGYS